MTTTPDLIDTLATGLKPMPRGFFARRLGLGLGIGALITTAAMLLAWGPRPDLATAVATPPFWMKFAFTGLLFLSGFHAVQRLSYPDRRVAKGAWLGMTTVVAVMVALAAAQLLHTSQADYGHLVLGSTAATCPWLIALLAIPMMAGMLWAMRAMAPTRLTMAGAAAGLAAGASAAFIYAFSCDESAAPFVLVWYGLGMALPTAIGAAIGSHVLRW